MGTPYVILATGQSNIEITRAQSWTPNARAKEWNNSIGDDVSTGSAYTALNSSQMGVAAMYASQVAANNPSLDVYLVRVTRGGRDITHWNGGAFFEVGAAASGRITFNSTPNTTTSITLNHNDVLGIRRYDAHYFLIPGESIWVKQGSTVYRYQITGATTIDSTQVVIPVTYLSGSGTLTGNVQVELQPRMVTGIDSALPPALVAAGKTSVDTILWWQGESDAEFNTQYESDFEFLMTYLAGNRSWFTGSTKVVMCGIAPTSVTGLASSDVMSSRLQALAAARSNRVFVNLAANISTSRWIETYHMTGQGYAEAGVYAASIFPGSSTVTPSSSILNVRNAAGTGWINAATASGFRIRNASNTGWLDKTTTLTGVAVRNSSNNGWITFDHSAPTYSIIPNTTSVNEGGSITYTISTTNFGSGTLYWSNSGTTNGSDFTDGLNSGSVTISSNTGTIVRTLFNDATTEGTQSVILNLRTGSVGGPVVKTAATVTVNDTSVGSSFPSSLTLLRNDLNFIYSDTKTSSDSSKYMEIIMTIDMSSFFSTMTNPDGHIVFALDPIGDSSVFSGGTRDHCGQILRNGQPLWDQARGFIIKRNGRMYAEHWYAGAGFGLDDLGTPFNPLVNTVVTVRLRAGYRVGPYGERMEIDVFNGTNTSGTLLAGSSRSFGWDYSGNHRFALAGIGYFVDPSSTGCIETTANGASYGSTVGISNFSFNII